MRPQRVCHSSHGVTSLAASRSASWATTFRARSWAVVLVAIVSCAARGVSAAEDTEAAGGEDTGKLDTQTQLLLAFVLICLSALFAGLTLGIMAVDTLTLEVIASAGSEPDKTHANIILPVRRKGHQTLCTLVLGNMWANVMIAQFCSDVNPEGGGEEGGSSGSGALVGFLLSTFIILIFTEVLPMSVCKSKNALAIAAKGVPILKVFMVLLFPVAWPLGKALDKLLHHDPGQVYDRAELKKLMMMHAQAEHAGTSGLHGAELQLMLGALEFREETVGRVMTPLRSVIMLEQQRRIDGAVLEDLWRSGHSRVPVYARESRAGGGRTQEESPLRGGASASAASASTPGALSVVSPDMPSVLTNNSLVFGNAAPASSDEGPAAIQVLGLVHVKDLIQLDPSRGITAADLLETYPHGAVQYLDDTEHLDDALRLLQANAAHLAVVREKQSHAVVGIVTLEDLVERLIKSEILDEFDDEEGDGEAEPHQPGTARRPQGNGNRLRTGFHSLDPRPDAADESGRMRLTRAQVSAAAAYLVASVDAFSYWPKQRVELLVEAGACFIRGSLAADRSAEGAGKTQEEGSLQPMSHALPGSGVELYHHGRPSSTFALVVSGGVTITAGAEGFMSEQRSWTWLGTDCLLSASRSFTPRFTATVSRDSCIVLIDSASYHAVLGGGAPLPVRPPAVNADRDAARRSRSPVGAVRDEAPRSAALDEALPRSETL